MKTGANDIPDFPFSGARHRCRCRPQLLPQAALDRFLYLRPLISGLFRTERLGCPVLGIESIFQRTLVLQHRPGRGKTRPEVRALRHRPCRWQPEFFDLTRVPRPRFPSRWASHRAATSPTAEPSTATNGCLPAASACEQMRSTATGALAFSHLQRPPPRSRGREVPRPPTPPSSPNTRLAISIHVTSRNGRDEFARWVDADCPGIATAIPAGAANTATFATLGLLNYASAARLTLIGHTLHLLDLRNRNVSDGRAYVSRETNFLDLRGNTAGPGQKRFGNLTTISLFAENSSAKTPLLTSQTTIRSVNSPPASPTWPTTSPPRPFAGTRPPRHLALKNPRYRGPAHPLLRRGFSGAPVALEPDWSVWSGALHTRLLPPTPNANSTRDWVSPAQAFGATATCSSSTMNIAQATLPAAHANRTTTPWRPTRLLDSTLSGVLRSVVRASNAISLLGSTVVATDSSPPW